MTELKNCPLCGAKPIVRRFKDAVTIINCPECIHMIMQCKTDNYTADERAALYWNGLTKEDIIEGLTERNVNEQT